MYYGWNEEQLLTLILRMATLKVVKIAYAARESIRSLLLPRA